MASNVTAVNRIKRGVRIVGYTLMDETTGQIVEATHESVLRALKQGGEINRLSLTADGRIRFQTGSKQGKGNDSVKDIDKTFINKKYEFVYIWISEHIRKFTVEKGYNYTSWVKDYSSKLFHYGDRSVKTGRLDDKPDNYYESFDRGLVTNLDTSNYDKPVVMGVLTESLDKKDIKYIVITCSRNGKHRVEIMGLFDVIALLDIYNERVYGRVSWISKDRVEIEAYTDVWSFWQEDLRANYDSYISKKYGKELALLMVVDKNDVSVPDLAGNIGGIKVTNGECALPPMVDLRIGVPLLVNGKKVYGTVSIDHLQFNGIRGAKPEALDDLHFDVIDIRNPKGFTRLYTAMATNRYIYMRLKIDSLKSEEKIKFIGDLADVLINKRTGDYRSIKGRCQIMYGQLDQNEMSVLALYMKHKIEVLAEKLNVDKYYITYTYRNRLGDILCDQDYDDCIKLMGI